MKSIFPWMWHKTKFQKKYNQITCIFGRSTKTYLNPIINNLPKSVILSRIILDYIDQILKCWLKKHLAFDRAFILLYASKLKTIVEWVKVAYGIWNMTKWEFIRTKFLLIFTSVRPWHIIPCRLFQSWPLAHY